MSKILKKAALFCLPFLLAFALFFLLEPYDYFGLRGDATYLSRPLSAMRALGREGQDNLILGDSRMANLSVPYIEQLTGERFAALSFGGATMGECVELFWYAAERTELQTVYFELSFYTLGGDLSPGRIPKVEEQAGSPWAFVRNFNNWLEAVNTAKYKTKNLLGGLLDKPGWIEYPEDPTTFENIEPPPAQGARYRQNLEDYAETLRGMLGGSWAVNPEAYTKLQEIMDYCDAQGIELIFVFPPMQESVQTLVIDPLGIAEEYQAFKDWLCARATVYDMEFVSDFSRDERNFYDGFHLMGEKKKLLAELIFTDVEDEAIRRTLR